MVKKSKVKYINIKLLPTELFQIPFHPQQIERYKGFGGYNYFDCLFHVLFVLKLRLYKQCHEDSIKMCKNKLNGVEINDTAKYLSSIFETPIERFINYDAEFLPYEQLKNGYATIVCGTFVHSNVGHYFIVHKQNDIIYCYDPTRNKNIHTNIYYENNDKKYDRIVYYYNTHYAFQHESMLNKNNMIRQIH
jgi:hypothetical protein